MSSSQLGNKYSAVEVTNVSCNGIWVLVNDEELFLPFEDFPWFRKATVEKIQDVELVSPDHLYWKELDIDIGIASIKEPNRFPLKAADAT